MRVLILSHGLPIGGTEVMICHLARRLRAIGIEAVVGCLDVIGELGETLRNDGIELELYGRKPGLDLPLAGRIARHVKERGFDVVHAHQYTPFFYGALSKLRSRVPLVFTEHGRFHPDLPSAKRRLFNFVFSRLCDRITAVSAGVRRALDTVERISPARVQVIYNGIDVDGLYQKSIAAKPTARAALDIPQNARVLGTVGRLDSIKNHPLLLAAVARLAPSIPDLVLAIAGDGPERATLEACAQELGIADRTRFLGMRRDLDRVYASFDLFALSSFSEGTPMTLIEAMATRVPIVSTGVGGIPEIVTHDREGLLVDGVPPSLPSAKELLASEYTRRFADTLATVLTDPKRAKGLADAGHERARREFSVEAITAQYVSVYESAISGR